MPRLFNRVLTFKVEGEIYDNDTKAEDIIKNYDWKYLDSNYGDDIHIMATHKDNRGRITKMIRLPKIHKYKKPDSELFLI